jgi:hypothetical protein
MDGDVFKYLCEHGELPPVSPFDNAPVYTPTAAEKMFDFTAEGGLEDKSGEAAATTLGSEQQG